MLAPGSLVRVAWPGSPLDGRTGVIRKEVTVEGLDDIGLLYAVRIGPSGRHNLIVLRADQLIPLGIGANAT